ncbi:hypothetical protein [Actinomyces bovis]|uniref:hypothetical protein n=1 Tax=Actinomyces bovis TaxID=1658 RepID=UPI00147399AC|nr:hypothetical protein [Actinomyces bovis]
MCSSLLQQHRVYLKPCNSVSQQHLLDIVSIYGGETMFVQTQALSFLPAKRLPSELDRS